MVKARVRMMDIKEPLYFHGDYRELMRSGVFYLQAWHSAIDRRPEGIPPIILTAKTDRENIPNPNPIRI